MTRTRLALEHEWQVGADWLDTREVEASLLAAVARHDVATSGRIYSRPPECARSTQIRNYGETFLEADLQLTSSFDLGRDRAHADLRLRRRHHGHRAIDGSTSTTTTVDAACRRPVNQTQGFNFPQRRDGSRRPLPAGRDRAVRRPADDHAGSCATRPTRSIRPADDDYVPAARLRPEEIERPALIKKLGGHVPAQRRRTRSTRPMAKASRCRRRQQLFVSTTVRSDSPASSR